MYKLFKQSYRHKMALINKILIILLELSSLLYSATSMAVGGKLLNPLTEYKRTLIGNDARNILYAVTAKVVE